MDRPTVPEVYFAASNSKDGFVSYFHECFDRPEIEKLYIIKGAPGTGKSKFMKDVASLALSAGGEVTRYLCSSDPNSLDGITVRLPSHTFAVIDATLPHGYEPRLPGLRDVIVDLGAFWKGDVLMSHKDSIVALTDEKKHCFDMAYKYLGASAALDTIAHSHALRHADLGKIRERAKKLMRHVPCGKEHSRRTALIDSVGMLGRVRLDTLERISDTVYCIDDFCSLGALLLSEILRISEQKCLSVTLSPDPIFPERLSALYIKESRCAFIISRKGAPSSPDAKHIDIKRLACADTHRSFSGKARLATKLSRELEDSSCAELERARICHFELERIYGSAMDFDAKEKFTKQFAKGILKA